MKKSIIAMAVAGALAVPAIASADATLYGNVELEGVFANDKDADMQVDDAIIGVKGNVDSGLEGATAFYQIEVEFNEDAGLQAEGSNDANVRLANAGLTGSWGTVIGGRIANPVTATETLDLYAESYSDAYWKNPDRLGSALAYVSPEFGGVSLYAGIVADGDNTETAADNQNAVDGYLLGANMSYGDFYASVGYWEFDREYNRVAAGVTSTTPAAQDYSLIGVAAGYQLNNLGLHASWQETEGSAATAETETWGLGVDYAMGATTIGATYIDFEDKNVEESDEWGLWASHALSPQVSIKAQYTSADIERGGNSVSVAGEDVFTVGYNVKF